MTFQTSWNSSYFSNLLELLDLLDLLDVVDLQDLTMDRSNRTSGTSKPLGLPGPSGQTITIRECRVDFVF